MRVSAFAEKNDMKPKTKIIYVLNCSDFNGTGHLRRFLTVKQNFKNYKFIVLIKLEIGTKRIIKKFSDELGLTEIIYYKNDLLNKIKTTHTILESENYIFDCKNIDEEIYLYLKKNNKYIVVFDDTSSYVSNYADLLIDANIHKKSFKKNQLFGENYIIFNKKIYNLNRQKRTNNRKIKNIFVCFGGTDPHGIVFRFLNICSYLKEYNFFIFTNHKLNSITANVNLISDTELMPEYMLKSDLGIISGGIMLYESLYLGLPVIVINQNQDQQLNCKYFINQGLLEDAIIYTELTDNNLINRIKNIDNDYNKRVKISKKSMNKIDGKGIRRLKKKLKINTCQNYSFDV